VQDIHMSVKSVDEKNHTNLVLVTFCCTQWARI